MTTAKTATKSSIYTPALTRAFKTQAGRHICAQDADGMIYATNGVIVVKLTAADYDAFLRPVYMTDPGNWTKTESGIQPTAPHTTPDLVSIWTQYTTDSHAEPLRPSGLSVTIPVNGSKSRKMALPLFYGPQGDFVSGYNPDFLAIVQGSATYKAAGSDKAMTIFSGDEPAAVVLPVRIQNAAAVRAVRSYFNAPPEEEKAANVQRIKHDRDEWKETAARLERERDELEKQLAKAQQERDEAKAQAQNEPPAEPAPASSATVDDLTAKVSALGLSCTVKGAQTAAPVLWIDGDPGTRKPDLEALGAKWSGKRSAWYIKAA
ncbi:MAG: hypothetical protein NC131_10875 [Roseburia sp.]|nr:hypothetical protein [Roseburia sp.]